MFKNMLPKEQQMLYPFLDFVKEDGFILFGGTAISLQIGHRISVDFDFFSKNKLDDVLKKNILQKLNTNHIIQDEIDTLVCEKNGVKLSFFGNIDFATNQNSFMIDDVLKVATLQTLLATKLKATFDRAEYKDYKDIVELLKLKGISLDLGIQNMKEFFSGKISTSQVLKNLTYFEDGDLHKLSKEDKNQLVENVSLYVENKKG